MRLIWSEQVGELAGHSQPITTNEESLIDIQQEIIIWPVYQVAAANTSTHPIAADKKKKKKRLA